MIRAVFEAEPRLPAHVEVAGLVRQVNTAGGFATVIQKGEREAGTIIVILVENGTNVRIFERMPTLDGARIWHLSRSQSTDNPDEIHEYVRRRGQQDRDVWIVELDIVNGERFIGLNADKA